MTFCEPQRKDMRLCAVEVLGVELHLLQPKMLLLCRTECNIVQQGVNPPDKIRHMTKCDAHCLDCALCLSDTARTEIAI